MHWPCSSCQILKRHSLLHQIPSPTHVRLQKILTCWCMYKRRPRSCVHACKMSLACALIKNATKSEKVSAGRMIGLAPGDPAVPTLVPTFWQSRGNYLQVAGRICLADSFASTSIMDRLAMSTAASWHTHIYSMCWHTSIVYCTLLCASCAFEQHMTLKHMCCTVLSQVLTCLHLTPVTLLACLWVLLVDLFLLYVTGKSGWHK